MSNKKIQQNYMQAPKINEYFMIVICIKILTLNIKSSKIFLF
jgi:hypothetical protein